MGLRKGEREGFYASYQMIKYHRRSVWGERGREGHEARRSEKGDYGGRGVNCSRLERGAPCEGLRLIRDDGEVACVVASLQLSGGTPCSGDLAQKQLVCAGPSGQPKPRLLVSP